MHITKADATLFNQDDMTPYQFIERIGRTCYKSEDNITEDSALSFVKQMAKHQHYAMLEHHRMIMAVCEQTKTDFETELENLRMKHVPNGSINYQTGKYFTITPATGKLGPKNTHETKWYFISGSLRTWLELLDALLCYQTDFKLLKVANLLPTLCMMCHEWHDMYPDLFKENTFGTNLKIKGMLTAIPDMKTFLTLESDKYIRMAHVPHTVKFKCDRGVTHELVRHRPASFAQESTRYCNYAKNKFGSEITVIQPCFYEKDTPEYDLWLDNVNNCEQTYFKLLDLGRKPQEARDSLPASVKTELFITATEEEWQHILNLRYHGTTGTPHPQAKEVMGIIYNDLIASSDNRLK